MALGGRCYCGALRYESEGEPLFKGQLGFVVLEAMSSGLPVVAANAGGVPDLVRDGENGILFDPQRPQEAAEAIAKLLQHDGMRRFYGQQARKVAEACDWTSQTEELLDAYRRAIVIHGQRGLLGRIHHAFVS